MRLKDKVAVVTGAGQAQGEGIGNGRATAITFAREGAQLLLANRSIESLEGTKRALEEEGYSATCLVADISQEEDCRKIAREAVAQFGRIDIVHNNVGIGGLARYDGCQFERCDVDLQAHTPGHAGTEIRLYHERQFDSRRGFLPVDFLQGLQGGAERVHPLAGV